MDGWVPLPLTTVVTWGDWSCVSPAHHSVTRFGDWGVGELVLRPWVWDS